MCVKHAPATPCLMLKVIVHFINPLKLRCAQNQCHLPLLFLLFNVLWHRGSSGLVIMALDYGTRGRQFESRFRYVISGVPPVHLAMMGSCIAESQRRPGVELTRSPPCLPWLWKPVFSDSYQNDGPACPWVELWGVTFLTETISPERRFARMSKVQHSGLDQYDEV